MRLALAFTGSTRAAVEYLNDGSVYALCTNATSSNILFLAAAAGRAACAVRAVCLVDEDEGGLLITGRTVRSGSRRNTKRADHCERGLEAVESKRCGGLGKVLGGFCRAFIV